MDLSHREIAKAVIKSQHCQRNWNLTKTIPEEDIDLLIHSVTNCPSKQNVAYYDVYFITDRSVIEKIHKRTNGFVINRNGDTVTNSQTLANLLIAFTSCDLDLEPNVHRNTELDYVKDNNISYKDVPSLVRDKHMAIGIAAGYVNLTAAMLGYSTGCCACFDQDINKIIGSEHEVELLMGVGFSNSEKNRRIHHEDDSFMFPTKKKQEIKVFKI